MDPQPETFHMFGDLRISDPQKSVSSDDYPQVERAISLIRKFKQGTSDDRNPWDFETAYQRLVSEDTAWWRTRNVIRPKDYIVHPSGSLGASVTCLLNNPTFSVEDPCFKDTFDLSNASIQQIERVGFNPSNALFIDQIARRDNSDHVQEVYTEDLWQIHERFLREVWNHMQATVVICWGSAVRCRLLGTPKRPGWLKNVEAVNLWGRYKGVKLFLELTPDLKSMTRFIVFVKHPAFFFYIQSTLPCAIKRREIYGRAQDLALEVAAKLGQIQIEAGFYEFSDRLKLELSVPHEVTKKRDRWKGEAEAQLQSAFPLAQLSQQKSHRPEGPKRSDPNKRRSVVSLLGQHIPGKVCKDGVPREEGVKRRTRAGHRRTMQPGTWLIRHKTELGTLPEFVELRCPSCKIKNSLQSKWTIADKPRLLIPDLRCGTAKDDTVSGCHERGYWTPVEDFEVIRQPHLSRLWREFKQRGCLLSEFPRDGSTIFFCQANYEYRVAKLKEMKLAQAAS